mgnify:CR=1 FL=1
MRTCLPVPGSRCSCLRQAVTTTRFLRHRCFNSLSMHRCEQQEPLKSHLGSTTRRLMEVGVSRESLTRVLRAQTSCGGGHGCWEAGRTIGVVSHFAWVNTTSSHVPVTASCTNLMLPDSCYQPRLRRPRRTKPRPNRAMVPGSGIV